jgi:hypothetical protein
MINLRSSGYWLRWPRELIAHVLQTTKQLVLNLAAIPLLEKRFSLYIKLRTSPLDTGLEQGYTCSIRLLNAPGKVSVLHPARPIEKARTSLAPSLR